MFADYAEMRNNMNDGILKDMRALLQQNGRLAANGGRRTGGQINELSKVVYTTCNLCAKDPTRPPLWQIRASSAVQDMEHKKIEYRDVTLDIYGLPVAYFPYFWHADPSVRRASGFLVPAFGQSKNLGAFGDAGAVTVEDDAMYERLVDFRVHGLRPAGRRAPRLGQRRAPCRLPPARGSGRARHGGVGPTQPARGARGAGRTRA